MQTETVSNSPSITIPELAKAQALVHRDAISGRTEMNVEGKVRNLGIVKNFKDHSLLDAFLPVDLSISWTHLGPKEKLDTHRHPVASLIIVVEGNGCSQGDSELDFQGGDALVIPAWNEHGFIGTNDGFWALSIQFSETAIFASEIDPLTTYKDTPLHLPEKNERQISVVSRSFLPESATFKHDSSMQEILPQEVDFEWREVASDFSLSKHPDNERRLIIVCTGIGELVSANSEELMPGSMVWQNGLVTISKTSSEPMWLLLLMVKNPGESL